MNRATSTKTWLAQGDKYQISEDLFEDGVVSLEVEGSKPIKVKLSKETMEEICRKYLKHVVEESWEDAEMKCLNN